MKKYVRVDLHLLAPTTLELKLDENCNVDEVVERAILDFSNDETLCLTDAFAKYKEVKAVNVVESSEADDITIEDVTYSIED